MKILPVLVFAEYDQFLLEKMHKQKIKREFPSKLYILNPDFYPNEFKMEPGDEGSLFVTRQHFYSIDDWHSKEKPMYVPGFCIVDLRQGESEADYEIRYKPEGKSEYTALVYFESSNERMCKPETMKMKGVYFEIPLFKEINIKKNKFRLESNGLKKQYVIKYDDNTNNAVLGSVNTGYTEIACFKKGNKKPELRCKLKVLPSSMTEAIYAKMIDDILAVHRSLIVSLDGGKQSIFVKKTWYTCLQDIENKIIELEKVFNQINSHYYKRLLNSKCNTSMQNIKKFNGKLLTQMSIHPLKRKYRADKLVEDNNIYEHRILLWALDSLLRFIQTTSTSVNNRELFDKQINKYKEKRFLKLFNSKQLQDICILIEALTIQNRDVIFDKFIECNNEVLSQDFSDQSVINGEVSFDNFCLYESDITLCMYNGQEKDILTGCGFVGTNFVTTYTCDYIVNDERKDLAIEFISNNVKWQELLYIEFSKIKSDYDGNRRNNQFSIFNTKENLKIVGKYKVETSKVRDIYRFYDIETLLINNIEKRPCNSVQDAKAHLKKVYNKNYDTESELRVRMFDGKMYHHYNENDSFLFLIKELKTECQRFDRLKRELEIDTHKNDNQKLRNNILKLKGYSFLMRLTCSGYETWNLTQKFINDQNYKKAYNILHNLNEMYHFTEVETTDTIIHQKANDLYEYWIFIKILEVLIIRQKWKLESINGITGEKFEKNEISYLVTKILSSRHNKLQNCVLSFSHLIGEAKQATLIFSYNKDIDFTVPIDGSYSLRPDYHFTIEYINLQGKLVKKHFCLDAKYRNYDEQRGMWSYDINRVCIDNYLIKLRKWLELNKNIDLTMNNTNIESAKNDEDYIAAFIIHCDKKHLAYWGGSLRSSINVNKLNTINGYPKHEIGSFPFVPNTFEDGEMKDFEHNLLKFFTMIFEYHCKLYDICWGCGNIKPKITEIGTSIHYLCDECNRFWVKYHCSQSKRNHLLVKHKHNYHTEYVPHTHFLVMCPECGDKLIVDDKRQ